MNSRCFIYKRNFSLGPLAQLVEHFPFKEGVDGSSPSGLTNFSFLFNMKIKIFRRRIKKRIPKPIRDYFFVLKNIRKRFWEYGYISKKFKNYKCIEIGGPSDIFFTKILIYQHIKILDTVNFSNITTWEKKLKEGPNCNYYGNKFGYQYILEATNLHSIKDKIYDAVLSSHSLEHIANPIKALFEWKRVLKKNGELLLVLPNKINNFDNKRPYTLFKHILLDYKNDIGEDDMTHYEEIIKLHDLTKHPAKDKSLNNFIIDSKNNYKNRHFHHHVFDKKCIFEMLDYIGFEIKHYSEFKEDLITYAIKKY